MSKEFKIIAITSPDIVGEEAQKINKILHRQQADIVHIRKPHWTIEQTAELLQHIMPEFYNRIKLHDHYPLLNIFPLLGVHLNSRNQDVPANAISVSRSFHDLSQLLHSHDYDYVTLSPIFDSISKPNYTSAFSISDLSHYIRGKRVIALGGVTPDKYDALKDAGFVGAAMLGYFWNKQN